MPMPRNEAEPNPSKRELKEDTGAAGAAGACCEEAGACMLSESVCTLAGIELLS